MLFWIANGWILWLLLVYDVLWYEVHIPLVIFGGVATSILTCYVPMYNRVKQQGKEQVDRFNSNLISIVFLVSVLIIVFFTIFDEKIITTFFI